MQQRTTIPLTGGQLDRDTALSLSTILESVPGVLSVYVSMQTEMAFVVFDPIRVRLTELYSLIESAGFRAIRRPSPLPITAAKP